MTPAEKKAIEKKLGRMLTTREEIFGEIERSDNRTLEQKSLNEFWQPTLAKPQGPSTIFDQAIIAAEQEAKARLGSMSQERLAAMTPEERAVVFLKQARAEELAKQQAEAANAARLKSPEVAKPLKALRDLRERLRWDPAYGMAEVEAVERAILQYETPGSDLHVAKGLFDQAFGFERSVKTTQRDAVLAKMQELGAQQAELDAALNALKGDGTGEEDAEFQSEEEASESRLWKAYQEASGSGDEAAANAARVAWSKVYDALPKLEQANATAAEGQQ